MTPALAQGVLRCCVTISHPFAVGDSFEVWSGGSLLCKGRDATSPLAGYRRACFVETITL